MLTTSTKINCKLQHSETIVPEQKTVGSAGMDLCSIEEVTIQPGEFVAVKTGFAMELPENHVGLVCPRSGLAKKHGITCLNAPGVIDSDFRDGCQVILINHGKEPFHVTVGMRVAQLLVLQYPWVTFLPKEELSETERGTQGFGSTGY